MMDSGFINPQNLDKQLSTITDLLEELVNQNRTYYLKIQQTLESQRLRLEPEELITIIDALDKINRQILNYSDTDTSQNKTFLEFYKEIIQQEKSLPKKLRNILIQEGSRLEEAYKGDTQALRKEIAEMTKQTITGFRTTLIAVENKISEIGKKLVNNNMNLLSTIWKEAKETSKKIEEQRQTFEAELYKENIYILANKLGLLLNKLHPLQKLIPIVTAVNKIYKSISTSPLGALFKTLFKITLGLPYMIVKTFGLEPLLKKIVSFALSLWKGIFTMALNQVLKLYLGRQKKPKVRTSEGKETKGIEAGGSEIEEQGKLSLNIKDILKSILVKVIGGALLLFPLFELDKATNWKLGKILVKGIVKIVWGIIKEAFKVLVQEGIHGYLPIFTAILWKSGVVYLLRGALVRGITFILKRFISTEIAGVIGTVLGGPIGTLISIALTALIEYAVKWIIRKITGKKSTEKENEQQKKPLNQAAIGKFFKKPAITKVAEREPELVIPVPKLEQLINKEIEREKILQKQKQNMVYLKPIKILSSQVAEKTQIMHYLPTEQSKPTSPTTPHKENKISIKEIEKTNELLNEILFLIRTKNINITVENKVNPSQPTSPQQSTSPKRTKGKIL